MEWRHNLVFGDERTRFTGFSLTAESNTCYNLWLTDPATLKLHYINFDSQGNIGKAFPTKEDLCDAILPYADGYILASYKAGRASIVGYTPDHLEIWKGSLSDADSQHWSLATGTDGILRILYSSCNLYDAYRQAHVVTVNPGADPALEPFFTVPDDDYPIAQLIIAQPEQLAVCARSRGAGTAYYILTYEGELTKSGAFSSHPHSKWAVPLCQTPLENGDILMGGYREDIPNQRSAWVCSFDAELSALNGKVVAGDNAEQAITAFAPQVDGTVLALCPPWRILRFSSKGLLTHVWETPSTLRQNSLTAILAAPDGGCFITGRSFSKRENNMTPAIWLGKIALNEFVEL